MAKNYNITDRSPLADDKIFYLEVDGKGGSNDTLITRTYLGVPDTPRALTNPDGSDILETAFSAGDTVVIRYNATSFRYELLKLKVTKAESSPVLTNGFSEAGYVSADSTPATDNAELFDIPSGLKVGYGGNGSQGGITVKEGIVTGQGTSPVKIFQTPVEEPFAGGATVIGDTLNDANHGGFFGFGSELQPYAKFGAGTPTVPEYSSESSVTGNLVVFDGQYTIFGGSTQSEYSEGDIALIDIIDDDLVSVLGRYRATLVDNGGALNWRVEGNVQDAIVSTNYTAGAIPSSHNNSFSIGNNAYITANNQIALGTTGGTGTIVTSYTLTTGTGTSYFDVIDANNIVLNDNAASLTIDPDGAGAYDAIVLLDEAGINIAGGELTVGGNTRLEGLVDVVKANPILTVRDTDTSVATAESIMRLAESGAADSLGSYWDILTGVRNSSPGFAFHIESSNSSNPYMTINWTTGNVGMGTNTPDSALHVENDSTATALKVDKTGGASGNILEAQVSGANKVYVDKDGKLFVLTELDATKFGMAGATPQGVYATGVDSTSGESLATTQQVLDHVTQALSNVGLMDRI